MQRREFLASALAASALTSLSARSAEPQAPRQFFELRQYHLRRGPKQKVFDDFFRDAALPAYRRAGLGPIGVFQVMVGPESPTAYVLFTFKTLEELVTAPEKVRADANYQKAGADFINCPATDPVYTRVESQLMVAFPGTPTLEIPATAPTSQGRIFELRTYESHNKRANRKKIEMFDVGETALFRRAGLTPVFFGETLVGPRLPNLTYMLTFKDLADRDQSWSRFGSDPDWRKLSTTPGYTDPEIVTSISNVLLRPASYSQI
jgi:hypothetical protein